MSNSDQTGDQDRNQGPDEEFFRKLFESLSDTSAEKSSEEQDENSSPNIGFGFTGEPRQNSQDSEDSNGATAFPGMPPGFDPSQIPGFPTDPKMMQQIMGQVQSMFSAMQSAGSDEGPVNWELTQSTAEQNVGEDAAVTAAESRQVDDALRLAEMWINEVTSFEGLGQIGQAVSRRQWVQQTFESWKRLTEPVAESVGRAMATVVRQQLDEEQGPGIPEELKSMLPPGAADQMATMMERMGGMAFAAQIGQAIGELAGEVHSGSDIGLPLAGQNLALLPANIRDFGKGLNVEDEEVLLYVSLREAARMRLFARAPWLKDDLFNAVAQYAAGIHINMERIEEAASQIDPQNPQEIEDLFGDGLFQTDRTPMQEAALTRIETTLALVEGWVDDVVSEAGAHLPSVARLRETMNRRRATGGPAEATFAALVGLELRPRRLRDAAALWAHMREVQGVEGRDAAWSHPDVQPDEQDLDDPQGYFDRRRAREEESSKIDEELKRLLDGGYDGPGSEAGS